MQVWKNIMDGGYNEFGKQTAFFLQRRNEYICVNE